MVKLVKEKPHQIQNMHILLRIHIFRSHIYRKIPLLKFTPNYRLKEKCRLKVATLRVTVYQINEKKCSCQINNIKDEVDNQLRQGAKKCESRRQSRLNTPSYVRDLVSRGIFVGTKKNKYVPSHKNN